MERIGTADYLFHNGNPATGEAGTIVPDSWLNSVQEELASAIEGLGGVLDAGVRTQLLQRLLATCFLPPGIFMPYAGAAAPSGWLLCDGGAVSRSTYAGLFAVIGTTYGVGDGATTFNVPDLRGRTPVGAGQGAGLTNRLRGEKAGAETHALSVDQMPTHNHNNGIFDRLLRPPYVGSLTGSDQVGSGSEQAVGAGDSVAIIAQGGGQGHPNMQPYTVANFIIKT